MVVNTFQDGIEKNGIFIDPNLDSGSESTEGTPFLCVKIIGFTQLPFLHGSPARMGR